jgi:hypothetical protein
LRVDQERRADLHHDAAEIGEPRAFHSKIRVLMAGRVFMTGRLSGTGQEAKRA